jgi:CubicO group peptidase (beta-lactamase class C family)
MTPELIANPRAWGDEEKLRAALIAAKPRWKRGTLAYMPYEFGWILAEVVRGATGRSLQSFLSERVPQVRFGAAGEELPSLARTYWQGGKTVVAGNDLSQTFEETNNLPEVLTAFVPAAGLVGTASELAAFYDALIHGKLIKPETLWRYTTGYGYELDKSNRIPLRMARGFLLGSVTPSIYGWWGTQRVFGHPGAFCALGWGEVGAELAVGIVTNGNRGPYESLMRFAPIGSAIRRLARAR